MVKQRKIQEKEWMLDAKDYKKYASKPNFVSQKIFSENLLLFMKLNQFNT